MKNKLSVIFTPFLFFNDLIERSISEQKLNLDDSLKFYLASLLSENMDPNKLLKKSEEHPYAGMPLAIIFRQSLLEQTEKRKKMLKYVGDYSLYVGGYFSESLKKGLVSHSYYISIGEDAFSGLSAISRQKNLSILYNDIVDNFIQMLLILKGVSHLTKKY